MPGKKSSPTVVQALCSLEHYSEFPTPVAKTVGGEQQISFGVCSEHETFNTQRTSGLAGQGLESEFVIRCLGQES